MLGKFRDKIPSVMGVLVASALIGFWLFIGWPDSPMAQTQLASVQSQKNNTSDPLQTTFNQDSLINVINGYREYGGVAGMQRDFVLDRAAQLHAEDMKKRGYYNHTTPDGVTAYQRIYDAVGRQVYAGENEDNVCSNATTDAEFARFSGSFEHNKNMLDPKVNSIGIGYIASDPSPSCNGYVVIDFAAE